MVPEELNELLERGFRLPGHLVEKDNQVQVALGELSQRPYPPTARMARRSWFGISF